MTYIKADLPEDTHRELRIRAAEQNTTIEEVAADYLEFAVEHRLAGAKPTTNE